MSKPVRPPSEEETLAILDTIDRLSDQLACCFPAIWRERKTREERLDELRAVTEEDRTVAHVRALAIDQNIATMEEIARLDEQRSVLAPCLVLSEAVGRLWTGIDDALGDAELSSDTLVTELFDRLRKKAEKDAALRAMLDVVGRRLIRTIARNGGADVGLTSD